MSDSSPVFTTAGVPRPGGNYKVKKRKASDGSIFFLEQSPTSWVPDPNPLSKMCVCIAILTSDTKVHSTKHYIAAGDSIVFLHKHSEVTGLFLFAGHYPNHGYSLWVHVDGEKKPIKVEMKNFRRKADGAAPPNVDLAREIIGKYLETLRQHQGELILAVIFPLFSV